MKKNICSQMFAKSSLQAVSNLRTILEQSSPPAAPDPEEGPIEMQELKETLIRNAATLPADFAAVVALVVIVYTGLNAPGFF